MSFVFGDSFDLYAAVADATAAYWDSGTLPGLTLVAGRFTGSQAMQLAAANSNVLTKASSATTDSIHHFVVAIRQTAALSGTTLGTYFQLIDGSTNQCCVVFRSDGAMLLTSATPAGTVLDTYTGAVSAQNTWFAFEIEVVIHNSAGSWAVRKNGNTSNDHSLGSLNTRPGSNTQANKLTIGMNVTLNTQQIDDLLWRSDASSVPWVGDIRCYTRMPASDASVQFSKAQTTASVNTGLAGSTAITLGQARYCVQQTAPSDGTINTATVNLIAGYTGNMKCAIFASAGTNAPSTVLATATPISNPATGANVFTFPTPATLTKGATFHIGFCSDTSSGTWNASGTGAIQSTTAYASFPVASPSITTTVAGVVATTTFTLSGNYTLVNEAQQDGATTYVYDSTVGDADFYGIASIGGTPASTIAVTTRGFIQKSDAGTRNGAVQLKSSGVTVASTSTALSTTWGWLWRTDTTDPATGAAWGATAVNNAQVGPTVTA